MFKKLRYSLEIVGFGLFLLVLRLLPIDVASAVGAALGRGFGLIAPHNKTAYKNLKLAFPDISEAEQKRIVRGMWSHLGRIIGEFAHLPGNRLLNRTKIIGLENLPQGEAQALFFSGHIGNWEVLSSVAHENGHPLSLIYRHVNNPFIDKLVTTIRASHCDLLIPKGHRSASLLVRSLKSGDSIAMLIDQKMNNGIPVPFFGHDAMTAPAIAQMALRFDIPIIPARVMRTKGAHFESTIFAPMVLEKTGNDQEDVYRAMTRINAMLEEWIREYPEQWFWVHRRWPRQDA